MVFAGEVGMQLIKTVVNPVSIYGNTFSVKLHNVNLYDDEFNHKSWRENEFDFIQLTFKHIPPSYMYHTSMDLWCT